MKSIDFTKPGGFPLTQDQLNHLQTSYMESIPSLAAVGCNNNVPTIISGMISTPAGGGITNVSSGWFYYNGEMIRFPAQSYAAISPGDALYVVIANGGSSVTYNDGSTPVVILDQEGIFAALVNTTPTDATRFLFDDLVSFGVGFGRNHRTSIWNNMVVNTPAPAGGVTGNIYYKKDYIANTLHIRASLGANNAQNFSASPFATYSLMGTLPAEYVPANDAYFIANYFSSGLVKDDLGVGWIKQINCAINTGGQFLINWIRPELMAVAYGIEFNTIIPLG